MASPSKGAPVGIPAKKLRKAKKQSSTPGSQKVDRCKAKPQDRVIAKRNRSAKSRPKEYEVWRQKMNRKRAT